MAPRVTPFVFEDSPINSGDYASVTCTVPDGDLPIKITWKLNGKAAGTYPDISISKIGRRGSALTIESISHGLAGNFTCAATNKAGYSEYSTNLQVNGYCILSLMAACL